MAAAIHDYNPMALTRTRANPTSRPEPIRPLRKNDGKYITRSTIAATDQALAGVRGQRRRRDGRRVGVTTSRPIGTSVLDERHARGVQESRLGLWNFTGSFGVCDSGRFDVTRPGTGKLDRGMLELLQAG